MCHDGETNVFLTLDDVCKYFSDLHLINMRRESSSKGRLFKRFMALLPSSGIKNMYQNTSKLQHVSIISVNLQYFLYNTIQSQKFDFICILFHYS